jgi:hypothetical protein
MIMTRSDQARADITALFRARNTLLWVVTREEARVERALIEAATAAKYVPTFWDCAGGLQAASGKAIDPSLIDPLNMLKRIGVRPEREVYVMRDLHKWLADPVVLRTLRGLARSLEGTPTAECRSIVVLSPSSEVPPELAGHAVVIDWPLPDRPEIADILGQFVEQYPDAVTADTRDAAIDAAVGLTAAEATGCYSRSMVTAKRIDPKLVAGEKKRVIAREKVLTWYDPDPRGLDAVGGLDVLKGWLKTRKSALSQRARDFGLPSPKGVMLVGVPGCGKSLTAKAVSAAWGIPLLRLDMGALRSKWIGESEANIRKALQVAETVSPCVLWLDEIEKALAGASGSQGDGGVAADALGSVLSWMQEREGSVFVIATANDVSALPPELLRKGRFDELFFVDLPTAREREAIVAASLPGNRPPGIAISVVARACEGFSGAEIAAIVPDAMFEAFADGERALRTEDLLTAAATVTPLSKTASEKIARLREWAKGRARSASTPEENVAGTRRNLDIE